MVCIGGVHRRDDGPREASTPLSTDHALLEVKCCIEGTVHLWGVDSDAPPGDGMSKASATASSTAGPAVPAPGARRMLSNDQ